MERTGNFDLDNELRKVAEATERLRSANGSSQPAPARHAPPAAAPADPARYDFEHLGEQIADGMVQAAQEQLTQAQNMLEQTKTFAEDVRNRITGKARELADINDRLKLFGNSILEAHRKFHDGPAE